jgi:CheY-like chemotaxis protein
MPEGGELRITARRRAAAPAGEAGEAGKAGEAGDGAAAAPWIALSVADTGTGIPDAVRDRVLEPFFTTKPAGEGTGLGLALVEATVRQAGGRVEIDSTPGAGTCVTLLLPEATAESETAVAAEEPAPAAALAPDPLAGQVADPVPDVAPEPPPAPDPTPTSAPPAPGEAARPALPMLVVDDEAPVRDWVALALEARGHAVLRAGSAAEAEARSAGRRLGLVISDVMLPDATGPDLAARLAADRPGLPVLFMSGVEPRRPAGRRLVAPGAPLLAKPFGEAALAAAVDRALADAPTPAGPGGPAEPPDGSDGRPSGGAQGDPRPLLAATAG